MLANLSVLPQMNNHDTVLCFAANTSYPFNPSTHLCHRTRPDDQISYAEYM